MRAASPPPRARATRCCAPCGRATRRPSSACGAGRSATCGARRPVCSPGSGRAACSTSTPPPTRTRTSHWRCCSPRAASRSRTTKARRSRSSATSGTRRSSPSATPSTRWRATGRAASASPSSTSAYLAPYAYEEFARGRPRAPVDTRGRHRRTRSSAGSTSTSGVEAPARDRLPGPRERRAAHAGSAQRRRRRLSPTTHSRSSGASPSMRAGTGASRETLRERMLAPLRDAWKAADGRIYDRYGTDGDALSQLEALPLYATLHSLAELEDDPEFARELRERKLDAPVVASAGGAGHAVLPAQLALVRRRALARARRGASTSCWASSDALRLSILLREPARGSASPPACCCFRSRMLARGSAPAAAGSEPPSSSPRSSSLFTISVWRGDCSSLNFVEPLGPFISISLWVAELYCFASVVLLLVQVGLGRRAASGAGPAPTRIRAERRRPDPDLPRAARDPRADARWPRARCATRACEIHVLDDGHRDEVRDLAPAPRRALPAGPRQHAKAGNLNHALAADPAASSSSSSTPTTFPLRVVPRGDGSLVRRIRGSASCRRRTTSATPTSSSARSGSRAASPTSRTCSTAASSPRATPGAGAFFVGSGAVFRPQRARGGRRLPPALDHRGHPHEPAPARRRLALALRGPRLWPSASRPRTSPPTSCSAGAGCSAASRSSSATTRCCCRGLPPRHRFGYFASLYHFFFPLARLVFWVTPLCYLLFHLHPILSEVSVLTARLLPYLLILPLDLARC